MLLIFSLLFNIHFVNLLLLLLLLLTIRLFVVVVVYTEGIAIYVHCVTRCRG